MFDFTSIMHTGSFSLQTVLLTMLTALILGVIIALVYRSSHSHTSSFAVVLGAFGLIRFRSATGSAWDIGFIFFAMAVGLAVGLGFLTLAALLTVVVCAAMFILERLHFGINVPKEKHLRITIPEDLEYSGIFDEPFKTYTNYARLERVKTINLGTMYELTYIIDLKDPAKEKEFIDALRCRNGNLTVIVTSVLRNKDDL